MEEVQSLTDTVVSTSRFWANFFDAMINQGPLVMVLVAALILSISMNWWLIRFILKKLITVIEANTSALAINNSQRDD